VSASEGDDVVSADQVDRAVHGYASSGRTVHPLGRDGAIRDWLVSPVWSAPCDDLEEFVDPHGSPWGPTGRWVLSSGVELAGLTERIFARHTLVTNQEQPAIVEGGELRWTGPFSRPQDSGTWRRSRASEQGVLDWSCVTRVPRYQHAIAGALLEVGLGGWRTFEISSTGPVAVWLGSELVASFNDVADYGEPTRHQVCWSLPSGTTPLLVASWHVSYRIVRHLVGVAVKDGPARVIIPSPGADERASAIAEQVLESISLSAWAVRGDVVELSGPAGAALSVSSGEKTKRVVLDSGKAKVDLPPLWVDIETFTPMSLSVGIDDLRCPVRRDLQGARLASDHRASPEGSEARNWRRELLEYVSSTQPGLARALARIHLGNNETVELGDLAHALWMVNERADCADFEALGLLRLWHDVPEGGWNEGGEDAVRAALLGFKYWIDQPGVDPMCYHTENHQLVFHTAEILAGEAFPVETFTNTAWTGDDHARHGRRLALDWLRRRLTGGFSEFNSNYYLAVDALSLVSLVDYASDPELVGLAEAVLDSLFFSLATHSWRGNHCSAHGRSYTPGLRSSRQEDTGPIMRALWGTGTLSPNFPLPATAVATSRRYELPALIRSVATDYDTPWCGRQVYRGVNRPQHDLSSHRYESDVRVYRTKDAMLSSVQDYRVGLPGMQEHIFGATLAPEVQVFCTWAAYGITASSSTQGALPRARQHRDAVLVVYPLAAGGLSAPTQVWFPEPWMDETARNGPWLAGRAGTGYVAIACAGGLRPVKRGETAYQVWLPNGDGQAYVTTIGGSETGQSFEEFVAGLHAPEFAPPGDEPGVRWTTHEGVTLALSWAGPFEVNGRSPDISADGVPEEQRPHLDNPACTVEFGADRLEASHRGHRLVLDLVGGRRLEPGSTLDVPRRDLSAAACRHP
jgi:hypothetical protein